VSVVGDRRRVGSARELTPHVEEVPDLGGQQPMSPGLLPAVAETGQPLEQSGQHALFGVVEAVLAVGPRPLRRDHVQVGHEQEDLPLRAITDQRVVDAAEQTDLQAQSRRVEHGRDDLVVGRHRPSPQRPSRPAGDFSSKSCPRVAMGTTTRREKLGGVGGGSW
jgi:hypothetical protein